jgi:hypothetical protein
MIDTIRIGHMIGPPLRKFSIRKLVQPVSFFAAAAEAPGAPLAVAGDAPVLVAGAPVAGDVPGAGESAELTGG